MLSHRVASCPEQLAMTSQTKRRLLAFTEVRELTGLSRATVWRLERAGRFPRRRQITRGRVGWRADEIDAWVDTRAVVGEAK
jgi:predicted DNA-binding transcriptional regulator AlpA